MFGAIRKLTSACSHNALRDYLGEMILRVQDPISDHYNIVQRSARHCCDWTEFSMLSKKKSDQW